MAYWLITYIAYSVLGILPYSIYIYMVMSSYFTVQHICGDIIILYWLKKQHISYCIGLELWKKKTLINKSSVNCRICENMKEIECRIFATGQMYILNLTTCITEKFSIYLVAYWRPPSYYLQECCNVSFLYLYEYNLQKPYYGIPMLPVAEEPLSQSISLQESWHEKVQFRLLKNSIKNFGCQITNC